MATKGGLQSYTVQEAQNAALGQAGSIHVAGGDPVSALNGRVFVAIQFLEDSAFEAAADGLVPEAGGEELWPSSDGASTEISTNGVAVDGETFPKGVTIYGRWTGFHLASGKVIAYVG